VAQTVLDELDQCPSPGQVAAVARCLDGLADQPGVPLGIEPSDPAGGSYLAAIPDHADAPVVIYRMTAADEEGDFLVTALVDRITYSEYQSAVRPGAADRPLDRAMSSRATRPAFRRARIGPPAGL
jgi:hypothetical protein